MSAPTSTVRHEYSDDKEQQGWHRLVVDGVPSLWEHPHVIVKNGDYRATTAYWRDVLPRVFKVEPVEGE